MVMTGIEARHWRDDIHEFVSSSGSYAERFRAERAWVSANTQGIAAALGANHVAGIASVMLTLYSCIAHEFIPDIPCVSLTEFLLDYEQNSRWPYQTA